MTILRKTLSAKIRHAINLAKELGNLDHPGMKGRLRETLISELIEPLLPEGVSATTGVLIDSKGTHSNQMDIIIYASDKLPPILQLKEQSIIPVDATIQVIEVKSKLTADEVKDCIKKAEAVKNLFLLVAGEEYPPPLNNILQPELKHPIRVSTNFSVFAFDSTLSGNRETEWERYRRHVKSEGKSQTQGYFDDICVVGKGYWKGCVDPEFTVEADGNSSEVIAMLIPLLNSIPLWNKLRGTPLLGRYFSDE